MSAAILLTSFAVVVSATAQQVIIRKAERVEPLTIRRDGLSIELPNGSMHKSFSGGWIFRRSDQPMTATFQPFSDYGLFVKYTAEARTEEGFSVGSTPGRSQFIGLGHRPAVVAQFTEESSLEAALDHQLRFDREGNSQSERKMELVARTTFIPGLTLSTAGGQAEASDFAGIVKDRVYGNLFAEQKFPFLPVRLRATPYLAQETTRYVSESERILTGLDTALLVDATAATTLTAGATTFSTESVFHDDSWESHTYYTGIEQKLTPTTTVRLRGGYEEQRLNSTPTSAGVVLGAESSFSLTNALSGGLQLRHRALEFIEAAEALPETILSLSIGGSF